jgi:hypothetical protein
MVMYDAKISSASDFGDTNSFIGVYKTGDYVLKNFEWVQEHTFTVGIFAFED